MGEERRRAERHNAHVGAEIIVDGDRVRSGITHDGSETGLMLLTRAKLDPGSTVTIRIFLLNDEQREVTGTVVRREPLSDAEAGLWREKVAIKLSEPQPDLAAKIAEVSAIERKTYG